MSKRNYSSFKSLSYALLVCLLLSTLLLLIVQMPCSAAYDWLFEKEPGSLNVLTEQYQGSTADYEKWRVVIRPPGADAEDIPMLLCLPLSGQSPFPVVVLLHGAGGSKDGMINRFATSLAQLGIASLAYDLPDHGERDTGTGTFWDDFNDWPTGYVKDSAGPYSQAKGFGWGI